MTASYSEEELNDVESAWFGIYTVVLIPPVSRYPGWTGTPLTVAGLMGINDCANNCSTDIPIQPISISGIRQPNKRRFLMGWSPEG
jgi:hypothetical protein